MTDTSLPLEAMALTLAKSKRHVPFWREMIEKFIRNRLSCETQKAYLSDLRQFFSWAQKNAVSHFEDVGMKKAIEYRDYLRSFGGKTVGGVPGEGANSTVGRKISALSSFFEFVAREMFEANGKAISNPFKRVQRFRVDSSVTATEALVKGELIQLMGHIDTLPPTLMNLRDRAIIKTLFGLVIRNKALINLKGKDFYALGDRFRIKYVDKGGKLFDEALHPNSARAIIDYLEAMAKEGREVLDEDPLFRPVHNRADKHTGLEEKRRGENTNKHLSVNQVTNILRRHCKRAGIGDWVSSHCAKATVTSELVERHGVHLAQRKTKHKKTDQVVAYYGKRREREVSAFDDLDYLTSGPSSPKTVRP